MTAPTAWDHRRQALLVSVLGVVVLGNVVACSGAGKLEVSAGLHEEIPTVVVVEWTTEEPGLSWVEFGTTAETASQTATSAEPSTEHSFHLYGLPGLADVDFTAYTQTDEALLEGTGSIETGGLPSELTDFEVTVYEPDLVSAEDYLLVLTMGTHAALIAMDRSGEPVWYRDLEPQDEDAPLPMFSDVAFSKTNDHMLFNVYGTDLDDYEGSILEVGFDGAVYDEVPLEYGHHSFYQHEDGTIAYVAVDRRDWWSEEEGEYLDMLGDRIMEVAPDGTTTEIFSTWDWREPDAGYSSRGDYWEQGTDWTHGNGLEYDPETDRYYFSLGYVDAILEIDRDKGALVRDYCMDCEGWVTDTSTPFFFPHDPNITAEGDLLLFSASETSDESMAIEYVFEGDGAVLEESWSFGESTGNQSVAEGKVHRFGNGNTLIAWSTAGIVREVTRNGEVAWQMETDVGGGVLGALPFKGFYDLE